MPANVYYCSAFSVPAVSEVSGRLQPDMVLFSSGEQVDEEKLCSLQVQSLDALLDRSPTHPPHHTLRKDFNGEVVHGGMDMIKLPCSVLMLHIIKF